MGLTPHELKVFEDAVVNAKRPVIFYDDDADGLCSYLLCQRRRGEAIGVRVHGTSIVTLDFARKVEENLPDVVIILDKPQVEQAFIDAIDVPIFWLDHHEPQKPSGKHVTYLNPRVHEDADNRSTTYWVYRALGRKEDLWVAAVGSISDWQITDVAEEFWNEYPDLLKAVKTPPEAIYQEPFETLIRMFQFNLKGDNADVRTAVKILGRVESPYELLNKTTPRAKLVAKRYAMVQKEYDKLLAAAKKSVNDSPILFHLYPTLEISLVSEVSNQLLYEYPDKIIFICRVHNGEYKLSIRSANREIASAVKHAMQSTGARGNAGGHSHACGGRIVEDDFPKFFEAFKAAIGL